MATWSTKDYGFGSGLKSPDYSGAFVPKRTELFLMLGKQVLA
jgi:hypothetical protein